MIATKKQDAEPTGLESVRHWSVQASDKAEPGRLAAGPGDRWCVVAASADRPHGIKITVAMQTIQSPMSGLRPIFRDTPIFNIRSDQFA